MCNFPRTLGLSSELRAVNFIIHLLFFPCKSLMMGCNTRSLSPHEHFGAGWLWSGLSSCDVNRVVVCCLALACVGWRWLALGGGIVVQRSWVRTLSCLGSYWAVFACSRGQDDTGHSAGMGFMQNHGMLALWWAGDLSRVNTTSRPCQLGLACVPQRKTGIDNGWRHRWSKGFVNRLLQHRKTRLTISVTFPEVAHSRECAAVGRWESRSDWKRKVGVTSVTFHVSACAYL